MFKNKKLMGLWISLAITVVMASVYLLSLQLMDTPTDVEEEIDQETSESVESTHETLAQEKLPAHESKAHEEHSTAGALHEAEQEKSTKDKKEAKSNPHGDSATSKTQVKTEKTEPGEHSKVEGHEESSHEEAALDLSKKYRPRIIGRCKLLFDRFNKMELLANQFHSFAYSYDGKSGYCADSGPQASLKLAKEIAISDCEKNKASAESYAPCFIYSSEK